MKWQYLLVAAVFIGAVAISLWTATRVDMQDIEHGLTNFSEEEHEGEEHEGLIEGGNVALYGAIVIILFFIALAVFVWSKYH